MERARFRKCPVCLPSSVSRLRETREPPSPEGNDRRESLEGATSVSGSQFNSGFSQKNRCPPDSFSPGCAWVTLSNPASSLTKKCPRMGAGFIAFAFPPTVLRTAFGKPRILPRAKNCPPDSFSPGCAWVALSNPVSSLTKKAPPDGGWFYSICLSAHSPMDCVRKGRDSPTG